MRRGRFAPTPSGDMHLGNAKMALLSWLQMRAAGGAFVLRIEDIDIQRSKPEITERIIADLRWLGLDWDEGPGADGPYGPYWQSRRTAMYEEALAKLDQDGRLYPCYC
ncbi:glutamate--tRNA ligase family protein, partial [Paenibacillus macerans]